jgi:RNA polymerase sigma factor (sigma-70 family)
MTYEEIEKYLPVVRSIAWKFKAKLPSYIQFDDLYQAGIVGLLDAFNRYDKDLNDTFINYARIRIEGAIIDCIRKEDIKTRSFRESIPDFKIYFFADFDRHFSKNSKIQEILENEDKKEVFNDLITSLNPRERLVMQNIGNLSEVKIGKLIGCGGQRVSQIKTRTVKRLNYIVRKLGIT